MAGGDDCNGQWDLFDEDGCNERDCEDTLEATIQLDDAIRANAWEKVLRIASAAGEKVRWDADALAFETIGCSGKVWAKLELVDVERSAVETLFASLAP
jgi:hypothetical protein